MARRYWLGVCACACLALSLYARGGYAQETASSTRLTTEHYLDWERVSDAQISPDGKRIIYTRQAVNQMDDKWDSALWIMNADGSQNRFLVKGDGARWSPDGKRVLYTASGDPKGSQIYVKWVDVDGPATQVTHVMESPREPKWSPDGKAIAFSMFVPAKDDWKISMPALPKDAKWSAPPRIVDTLHYRQDKVGMIDDGAMHLFVVTADGGTPRQLTSGKWSVGAGELRGAAAIDWTPDSKAIVFNADRDPRADLKYQNSQLYVIDVASGAIRDLVAKPGAWTKPVVSPDGKLVAFMGYPPSAHTHSVSDLYVVAISGENMQKISGAFDRDPINLYWAPDSKSVTFDAEDHGARNVYTAGLTGGVKPVTTGAQVLTLDSLSRDMTAAGTWTDADHPQDVVRFGLSHAAQVAKLTAVNDDVLAPMKIGKTEEVPVTSSGGVKVQAWTVTPPDFDASKKYPLVLEIHGGPFSMYNVGFNYMFQNFAANGYVLLFVNPRGSTGYGSDFSNGIDHNYPGPDYDDLMASVDAVVAKGSIDTAHMYVSGCSGGGVLSSWVVGHTDRFAAAAVRCPVIDWISMAGHTDVPLFTYSFFEKAFWDDPTQWLAHSSLMAVGKITTPTLLMTGVLDRRTPMPQTEEFYAALKVRGVPTAIVQFNDEYHGTGGQKPSNFIRTQLYMMSWFKKYSRANDGKVVIAAESSNVGD